MTYPEIAPYGSWKSPITIDVLYGQFIGLGQTAVEGQTIYWGEIRPNEGGRTVIMRRSPNGELTECTPAGYNARTMVHEYGGGDFGVLDGVIYFSNFTDQRIYRYDPGQGEPQPLTPEGAYRYADYVFDRQRNKIYCVREDHSQPGEAVNTLVSIDLTGGDPGHVLVQGNNFYASPRLSPDGRSLAWQTWNHPNMPWDGCEVWVAQLEPDGSLGAVRLVAGGLQESIFQPQWSPDGRLYFNSDRSGWWNLYRWQDGRVEALWPLEAEFGQPQWVFGMSTYDFQPDGRLVCTFTQDSRQKMAWLDPNSGEKTLIDIPYTTMGKIRCGPGFVIFDGGSPQHVPTLLRLDLASGSIETLRSSREVTIPTGYFSIPEAIEFPTENGLTAYGFFYPPTNPDFIAPASEKPPLLVICHGGPTSSTVTSLRFGVQFWTSRGFGVLDVDYGGSSGYGRPYRERLSGQWGVVDVQDCVNGARYLASHGRVDGNRMAITGGSAGGYIVLCALTFYEVFRTGASYFGISDLEPFAGDTHKFESRYTDRLIGPYPQMKDVYYQRSPINFLDRLNSPLILFQGLDDKIVPPNQSEMMYEAVKSKGLPVAYLAFEGEGHGFRRAESNRRATAAELYFYARVFGFTPADELEKIVIDNLPEV